MAINKYHERNVVVYAGIQAGAVPATIVPADAIKALSATRSVDYTVDETEYLGDFADRDIAAFLDDHTAAFEIEVYGKVLGALDPALTVAEVPLSPLLQSSGGFVAVNGISGEVNISNANASNDLSTLEFRKQTPSPTNVGTEKVYRAEQCLGTVDLDIEIGKRPKLAFKFQGDDILPADQSILVPDYGSQVALEAPVIRGAGTAGNIANSTITNLEGVAAPIELCWKLLKAANLFGFDLTRFKVSCEELFEQSPVTPDVVITVLETELQASNFDPEANILKRFSFNMKYGVGAGENFGLDFPELLLVDVKDTTIDNFFFKELTFRNVKTSAILLT